MSVWPGRSLVLLVMAAAASHARAANEEDSRQRALEALRLLGAEVDGATGTCGSCHTLTPAKLREWGDGTLRAHYECLREPMFPAMTARERVDCLRVDRAAPDAPFSPRMLGVFAAGAHLPRFETLFREAYPDDGAARYRAFVVQVGMPPHGVDPLPAADFERVFTWVATACHANASASPAVSFGATVKLTSRPR